MGGIDLSLGRATVQPELRKSRASVYPVALETRRMAGHLVIVPPWGAAAQMASIGGPSIAVDSRPSPPRGTSPARVTR